MDGGEETTLRAAVEVALPPEQAFAALVDELPGALSRAGLELEPGPDGRVRAGSVEVGRVVRWDEGREIRLEWRPADWAPGEVTEAVLRCTSVDGRTAVTLEHRGWGRLLAALGEGELVGWFADQVVAPLLRASSPAVFGDWVTDRGARRPAGARARADYRDPVYHRPNFAVLLELLAPAADDHLLEVGCGGGAFLEQALLSGCRAAAVDHSPQMVRVARELNHQAVEEGRLVVVEADAHRLPFPDGTFTCAVMTGVLGFLSDPVRALAEIRRVLTGGGRLALLGADPRWRGSPAAPEPFASRLRFYEDDELERLAREAGLADVRVERRELLAFAREAGVPEEHLPLFEGTAPFLLARRGGTPG